VLETLTPDGALEEDRSYARLRGSRIVEVHVRRLVDVDEVAALRVQVAACIHRAGQGAVICADHRFGSPLSSDVADAWSRVMRRNDGHIVRRGLLLDPANAMYNLQLERIVHCAGNDSRRFFTAIDELREWVGEVLSGSERGALDGLFDGGFELVR
jgi:hypothetical protein